MKKFENDTDQSRLEEAKKDLERWESVPDVMWEPSHSVSYFYMETGPDYEIPGHNAGDPIFVEIMGANPSRIAYRFYTGKNCGDPCTAPCQIAQGVKFGDDSYTLDVSSCRLGKAYHGARYNKHKRKVGDRQPGRFDCKNRYNPAVPCNFRVCKDNQEEYEAHVDGNANDDHCEEEPTYIAKYDMYNLIVLLMHINEVLIEEDRITAQRGAQIKTQLGALLTGMNTSAS